jgi:glycosyltransferase involved in cell wall biosynthesis
MPGCSVIVCTRCRAAALARCLASLGQIDEPEHEVVIVDNSEGDRDVEGLAEECGARYLVESRLGLSFARNAGIDVATGEVIAFLDDDAVVDPGWLREHATALSDDSLTATTGRVVPVGKDRALDLGEQAFTVDQGDRWWFERANFGGLGSGANMAFKRWTFDRGLRFRETLGRGAELEGFEDYYLWFKMIEQGARIAYVPTAVIKHGPELSTEPTGRRLARDHRRVAAYLTMLFVEEPGFRRRTLRYAADVLRAKRLPWRTDPAPNRLRVMMDGFSGPLAYLRSRLVRR